MEDSEVEVEVEIKVEGKDEEQRWHMDGKYAE